VHNLCLDHPEGFDPLQNELISSVLPILLNAVQCSTILGSEEKREFTAHSADEIARDPLLLCDLFLSCYNMSLVAFCEALSHERRTESSLREKAAAAAAFFRANREGLVEVKIEGLPQGTDVITCIPNEILSLPHLAWLEVVRHKIQTIHPVIGLHPTLFHLDLEQNVLRSLPHSLGQLRTLCFLFLPLNPSLRQLPDEIASLPNLHSLAVDRDLYRSLPRSFFSKQGLTVCDQHGESEVECCFF
jgi:hypothetical protein